jgi:hypothetical protein
MTISSTLYQLPNFKHYRRVYKTLNKRIYCKVNNCIFSFKRNENNEAIPDDEVVMWSIDLDGFVLRDGVYLVNNLFACFSPYTLYWLIRYQIFFKKLLKSNTIFDVTKV